MAAFMQVIVQKKNGPVFSNLMSEYIDLDLIIAQVKQDPESNGVIVAGEGVPYHQRFMEQLSNYIRVDRHIDTLNLEVTTTQPNGGFGIIYSHK